MDEPTDNTLLRDAGLEGAKSNEFPPLPAAAITREPLSVAVFIISCSYWE